MKREAQVVWQVERLPAQEVALAQAGEVTARGGDELGAGLLLLQHLNPRLCFPLFLLGRGGKTKIKEKQVSHK